MLPDIKDELLISKNEKRFGQTANVHTDKTHDNRKAMVSNLGWDTCFTELYGARATNIKRTTTSVLLKFQLDFENRNEDVIGKSHLSRTSNVQDIR